MLLGETLNPQRNNWKTPKVWDLPKKRSARFECFSLQEIVEIVVGCPISTQNLRSHTFFSGDFQFTAVMEYLGLGYPWRLRSKLQNLEFQEPKTAKISEDCTGWIRMESFLLFLLVGCWDIASFALFCIYLLDLQQDNPSNCFADVEFQYCSIIQVTTNSLKMPAVIQPFSCCWKPQAWCPLESIRQSPPGHSGTSLGPEKAGHSRT